MGAKYTEAQKRATAKYQKENTSLIGIRVQKKRKSYIRLTPLMLE